ncbi:MAG TPA: polysaccharide deacetylase family protein [Kofleriaceae bacterium]|nr:polysaccharide deacetylase family protein [Kofleriaceae bacterium]
MIRAFAVKGVTLALALAACWLLPAGWATAAVIALVVAMVGFFAYTIGHPHSRFFVPVVDRLAGDAPVVALTFDDGPDPEVTPRVLDALAARGVRATFFVLGARAARHPELIARMQREGHAVGTHTQHHSLRFHFARPAHVQREIEDAIAVVGGILGERPTLFRPPQGVRTPLLASAWRRLHGLTCVTWSVRGFDSRPTTARAIADRIVPRLGPGAIVTLHDGTGLGGGTDREPTLRALDEILRACEARGLRCVALG